MVRLWLLTSTLNSTIPEQILLSEEEGSCYQARCF